jgi:hypothetical protein
MEHHLQPPQQQTTEQQLFRQTIDEQSDQV